MKKPKLIYVSVPYTHTDGVVKCLRFWQATEYAAKLARDGYSVYSPITMAHPIESVLVGEELGNLTHDDWLVFDEPFLQAADELHILMLVGWARSRGVEYEIKRFLDMDKPVKFIEPNRRAFQPKVSE